MVYDASNVSKALRTLGVFYQIINCRNTELVQTVQLYLCLLLDRQLHEYSCPLRDPSNERNTIHYCSAAYFLHRNCTPSTPLCHKAMETSTFVPRPLLQRGRIGGNIRRGLWGLSIGGVGGVSHLCCSPFGPCCGKEST